jgi:AraC-like DNA-binding protein
MIVQIKDMIERCIARFRQGACATCDNRKSCPAGRWQHAFGMPSEAAAAPQRLPFLAFLGEVAKSLAPAAKPARSFSREVKQRLETLLEGGDIGIDRIASELGCSRQTLYRRLKEEGVTYEQLLDALRRRLALRYLERDGLGVKQVAYRLGFSDPAAFSRAFKRWTGSSPGSVRATSSAPTEKGRSFAAPALA